MSCLVRFSRKIHIRADHLILAGDTGLRGLRQLFVGLAVLLVSQTPVALGGRIPYNNQQLFLSGANLAWVSFAKDVGSSYKPFDFFSDVLLRMHDHGGNALRWWLHTNGTTTPEFNGSGLVAGPGTGTIEDMRVVLDLAWEREIGVIICLWSFDMLETSMDNAALNRNILLLADTSYTRAYIDNCLIPMVDSLKGHPAIIAWEIFNEPEGMSVEFGWSHTQHVPMATIQRFVNLCAGAIHRTDSTALVTSGAWSFLSLTDVPTAKPGKVGANIEQLLPADRRDMEIRFARKYGVILSAGDILSHMQQAAALANVNYYTDARLIAAGGDSRGVLDFYSVHYYDWAGSAFSPFHHNVDRWGLDKALVVAEFDMRDTYGVPETALFDTLYRNGYAGALPWSWTDPAFSTHEEMLRAMQIMWDNYRADVDVDGIGGDWPNVVITSPTEGEEYPDSAQVIVSADASDNDGTIVRVEFFVADTTKIGEIFTEPYTFIWSGMTAGVHVITAVATDDRGHHRTSGQVRITVGSPAMVRLEAENAVLEGSPSVRSNPAASNGSYVTMQQAGTITWRLPGVPDAGTYDIAFGYRLSYDTPKNQYINVNGSRVAEVVFDGPMFSWLEKRLAVGLVEGENVIQMELSWGWMDIDYLGVPGAFQVTLPAPPGAVPFAFDLFQNYPNPFNSRTTISYSVATSTHVRVVVYDILGREITVLVDESRLPGVYSTPFDGSTRSSGVYIYLLKAGSFTAARRMMLLK